MTEDRHTVVARAGDFPALVLAMGECDAAASFTGQGTGGR